MILDIVMFIPRIAFYAYKGSHFSNIRQSQAVSLAWSSDQNSSNGPADSVVYPPFCCMFVSISSQRCSGMNWWTCTGK
ncbi:hypothetical protein PAHAL_8G077500 [Panicum hallii]|uniref:Uncharacterized protein n=1 Tax=Panicum hallii TaxID=206008 RepID=A0A2T8I848_9POAL|nr:hypothetical protein PAHAL_8G077500 [Panicum hallii]